MLKGVNQICFNKGTSVEKMLELCSRAGLDALELNIQDADGVAGVTINSTASEVEVVGKLANQYGIQLRSISTAVGGKYPLTSGDPATREMSKKAIRKQLEIASLLGMDTILIQPGQVDEQTPYDVCYKRSQEEIIGLLSTAEKHRVTIAIENVWKKFLLSPLEAARFVDEIDSKWLGFYFDVGNILHIGYPEQWIRILGERIRKIHVKDFRTAAGNNIGFVHLLAGDVNWKQVNTALQEIGYKDTIIAELPPYSSDPEQMVFDTARQMEAIFGKTESQK